MYYTQNINDDMVQTIANYGTVQPLIGGESQATLAAFGDKTTKHAQYVSDLPILFFTDIDDSSLEELLALELFGYIQLCDSPPSFAHFEQNQLAPSNIFLSLCTKTCFDLRLAEILSLALTKRIFIPNDTFFNISTALHEAISNTIIHGNLGIEHSFTNISENIECFKNIEEKLADKHFAQKRVQIMIAWGNGKISVTICDEGPGFCWNEISYGAQTKYDLPYGRGIDIIKNCTKSFRYINNGAGIVMDFE